MGRNRGAAKEAFAVFLAGKAFGANHVYFFKLTITTHRARRDERCAAMPPSSGKGWYQPRLRPGGLRGAEGGSPTPVEDAR